METRKKALITGGSDGIGLAIATAFIANGYDVFITGRSTSKLAAAATSLGSAGGRVITWAGDLGATGAAAALATAVKNEWAQLDVLVNNAGMGKFIPFADTTETALDEHLDLNVKLPYFLSQQLLPLLLANKGNIINISSYFSHRMLTGRTSTAYSLTKGAVDAFTKALAFELGPQGIRVNAIAPGSVNTSIFQANMERLTAAGQQEFYEMVKNIYPLGRIGTPEDISAAALFLASGQAQWITGSIMAVDGGLTTN
jgi:NAD(P)-dependent dehydrogenase (short-subunit alcohol dehydrogenase family)